MSRVNNAFGFPGLSADPSNRSIGGQPSLSSVPAPITSNGGVNAFGVSANSPVFRGERSAFDVTVGAALYGAADTGAIASRLLGSVYDGPDPFDSIASSLEEFKTSNPQYAPEEVDSALDLLSNPSALVSRVSSGIPYIAGLLGLSLVSPLSGIALAGLIEGRRGYEEGIATGLDENSATTRGVVYGTIGALLNAIPAQRLLKGTSGSNTSIISAILHPTAEKAFTRAQMVGAVGDAAKFIASQTVLETLEGRSGDLIDLGLFGRELPKNFWDLAAQDAITGAVTSELLGGAIREGAIASGKVVPRTRAQKTFEVDTPELKYIENTLRNNFKYDENLTKQYMGLTRGYVAAMAEEWGVGVKEASARLFATQADPGNKGGVTLAQPVDALKNFFLKSQQLVDAIPEGQSLKPQEVKAATQQLGITDEELYWTGLGKLIDDPKTALVSREELQELLDQHELRIVKDVKGREEAETLIVQRKYYREQLAKVKEKLAKSPQDQSLNEQATKLAEEVAAIDQNISAAMELKEEDKVVPGLARDYAEILFNIPVDEEKQSYLTGELRKETVTKMNKGPGVTAQTLFSEGGKYDNKSNVGGKLHDPNTNLLFTIRRDIRTDAKDGKGLYVVHDVKSDWAEDRTKGAVSSSEKEAPFIGFDKDNATDLDYSIKSKEEGSWRKLAFKQALIDAAANPEVDVLVLPDYATYNFTQAGRHQNIRQAAEKVAASLGVKIEDKIAVVDTGEETYNLKSTTDLGQSQLKARQTLENRESFEEILSDFDIDPVEVIEVTGFNGQKSRESQAHYYGSAMNEALKAFSSELRVVFDPGRAFEQTFKTGPGSSYVVDQWDQDGTLDTVRRMFVHLLGAELEVDTKKLHVPGIRITPEIRQKIMQEGFSLYQPASDLPDNTTIKAVRDETGHIYALDANDHAIVLRESGVPIKKIKDVGLIRREGAETHYVEIPGGVDMYRGGYDPANGGAAEQHGFGEPESVKEDGVTVMKRKDRRDRGIQLYQPNRAAVTFLSTGQALFQAFAQADGTSFWHEMSHVIRKNLSPEKQELVKKWLGVKDVFSIEAEEKFATAMERWAMEGPTPSGELAPLFNSFKTIFKNVYGGVRSLNVKMPDEVRFALETIFKEDHAPQAALKMRILKARERENALAIEVANLKKPEKKPKAKEGEVEEKPEAGPSKEQLLTDKQAELRNLQDRLKLMNDELGRLNSLSFRPGTPSEAERMAEKHSKLPLSVMQKQDHWFVSKAKDTWDYVKENFVDLSARLDRTEQGKHLKSLLREKEAIRRELEGQWALDAAEIYESMPSSEKSKLASDPERTGFWLRTRMTEEVGIPENLRVKPTTQGETALKQFYRNFVYGTGKYAQYLNVQRRIKGSWTPTKPSEEIRIARQKTPAAVQMLENMSGPAWEAYIKKVQELNPGIKRKQIEKEIEHFYSVENRVKREFGGVEYDRKIKYEPDVVYLPDGSQFVVHPPDVYDAMSGLVRRTANRLSHIETFGQGVLKDVSNANIARLAVLLSKASKPLGEQLGIHYDEKKKKFAIRFNEKSRTWIFEKSNARLIDELSTMFDGSQLNNLSRIELLKLARTTADEGSGIKVGLNGTDLVKGFKKIDPRRFFQLKESSKALRQVAREVGGIDTLAEVNKVWADLIKRIDEKRGPEANVIRSLFRGHKANGGDAEAFTNVIALSQGIIPPRMQPDRTTVNRAINFVTGVLGQAQTSLAAVPNLTQTITQVPQLAGLINFDKALAKVLRDPKTVEADLVAMGAFWKSIQVWTREPGRTWETLGRWAKNFSTTATGQRSVAQLNNLIAGQAFRELAESWRTHGVTNRGRQTAKFLGLSDNDIAQINNGKMNDRLFKRIIQEGVAKTQFVTEPVYLQAKWSRIGGIPQLIMAYQSYAIGTIKANYNVVKDLWSGLKSKDAGQFFAASQRLFLLVAGLYGAGVASQIMRQAIKGDFRKERELAADEEGEENRFWGALTEAGLLGPAQRMISGFDYDGGMTERFMVGLFPQIKAIADIFNSVVGRGPFGEFSIGRRFDEAAKKNTPAYKAFHTWIDSVAFPDHIEYKQIRERSNKFQRDLEIAAGGGGIVGEVKLNADYYPIFEYAARGDVELAAEEMKLYVRKVLNRGHDLEKGLRNLRSSLVARSPIPFGQENLVRFLVSLPSEKRAEALRIQARYMRVVDSVVPR